MGIETALIGGAVLGYSMYSGRKQQKEAKKQQEALIRATQEVQAPPIREDITQEAALREEMREKRRRIIMNRSKSRLTPMGLMGGIKPEIV